jgi:hypothetical protein
MGAQLRSSSAALLVAPSMGAPRGPGGVTDGCVGTGDADPCSRTTRGAAGCVVSHCTSHGSNGSAACWNGTCGASCATPVARRLVEASIAHSGASLGENLGLHLRLRGGGKLAIAQSGAPSCDSAGNVVRLGVSLGHAGADTRASLYCKDSGGTLRFRSTLPRDGAARVDALAGQVWVLKGRESRAVLLRVKVQPLPVVQEYRVDVDGESGVCAQRMPSPASASMPEPAQRVTHSRSPTAIVRRRQLKREKRKAQALLAAAADVVPTAQQSSGLEEPRGARLQRAEKVAFARGVAAARAVMRERRGAKRIAKKQSKATVRAALRSARRRKAAGL